MIQPEWLNPVLGLFMPLLVRLVINANWSRVVKTIIALVTSICIGFLSTYLTGQFSIQNILTSISIIFSISQIAYNLFWKDVLNK